MPLIVKITGFNDSHPVERMKTYLLTLFDNIRAAIAETQFDNQFERQHVKTAAKVAFLLAFCSELTPDEEATVQSKSRKFSYA